MSGTGYTGTNIKPLYDQLVELRDTLNNGISVDQGTPGATPWPVREDFALGEVLDDQVGDTGVNGGVLEFTFSEPVIGFWVAAMGEYGVVKVDHYGGTPSNTRGIPVEVGGQLPIMEPATTVKVYAPDGVVVTVWGHRR